MNTPDSTMTEPVNIMGIQKPRLLVHDDFYYSDFEAAIELGRQFGIELDEWQQILLKFMLTETESGVPAISTVGVSVPRQNGKNGALEVRELYGLVHYGERILHTAHQTKTALNHFNRMQAYFEGGELKEKVKKLSLKNGEESIELHNGGILKFIARSKSSGRGFSADILVVDEAQEYSQAAQAALRPTLATSKNPVVILTGTPPDANTNGEVFAQLRSTCLDGNTTRKAWIEWSADPESDMDSVEAWRAANPALGYRIQMTTIEDERDSMDDGSFARERLGMWSTGKSGSIIDPRTWELRSDSVSMIFGPETLSIDCAPDFSTGTIAASGRRKDGLWHIEAVEQRTGMDWIPEVIMAIWDSPKNQITSVVIDERNAAMKFVPELQKAGIPTLVTNMAMMGAACEGFYELVMSNDLRHRGQPPLTMALSLARKRTINYGSMWAWQRASSTTDLTPLIACTLALYGAKQEHLTPTVKKRRGPIRSR